MKQVLKSYFAHTLAMVNAFPATATDTYRVHNLLMSLHPLVPNGNLVRFGPRADGGYVLPDDIEGIEACFSPGVGFISGFEKDCASRGMNVFLADKSVEQSAEQHELFHFTRKFIGAVSNDDFMTLDQWVNASPLENDAELLLQIDIDGYEYEVFLSASEVLMRRFRIIVAEFHDLDQLWNKPFFNVASRAFEKILQTHVCVHIHPNNSGYCMRKQGIDIPSVMEFTFQRRDRIAHPVYQEKFPHLLDCDNTENAPLVLPRCWYRARQY